MDAQLLDLPPAEEVKDSQMSMKEALAKRRSRQKFNEEALSMDELSFLLWATQGVQEVIRGGTATLRPAASGGARHPFETYILVFRVDGLKRWIHRYVPLEHKLVHLGEDESLTEKFVTACMKQGFVGKSAVAFAWTCIPYRTEWSYDKVSHKIIAIDAGHVCQNLYLACESANLACCAVGAYHQGQMDQLLKLDGVEEFTIYMAVVGKY